MAVGQHRHPAVGDTAIESSGMMRWLLTYADMITLLLILFVILFAVSTISPKKFEAVRQGIVPAFNAGQNPVSPGGTGLLSQPNLVIKPSLFAVAALVQQQQVLNPKVSPTTAPQTSGGPQSQTATATQLANQIQQALSAKGLASQSVSITVEKRGVVVQVLSDKVYYAVDVATLSPVGQEIVDTVAGVVANFPNNIVVEGYTDNQPVLGGPFKDNWDLSTARAGEVVRRLNQDGIAESRLAITGYGEVRPVVANDNPVDMALNRRTDIVILNGDQSSVGQSAAGIVPAPAGAGTSTPAATGAGQ